jgi:hypothetical protein
MTAMVQRIPLGNVPNRWLFVVIAPRSILPRQCAAGVVCSRPSQLYRAAPGHLSVVRSKRCLPDVIIASKQNRDT